MSKLTATTEVLRATLEELFPTPCFASDLRDWCGQRFEVSSLLKLVGASLIGNEPEGDAVLVAYRPEPELEECLAALCFRFKSLTMKELKIRFRKAFPETPFREPSLMMAIGLDPRIHLVDDARYTFYPTAQLQPAQGNNLRASLSQLGLQPLALAQGPAWGIMWEGGIHWVANEPSAKILEGELDESDLLEAIEQAPEGGVLKLGSTTIRLRTPVSVQKSLTIRGAGPDQSQIIYHGLDESGALELCGQGSWVLADLSIRIVEPEGGYPDEHWNTCLSVQGGNVEIMRCHFRGAACYGLYLAGQSTGQVSQCFALDNHAGICVTDNSNVALKSNDLHANRDDGILVLESASSLIEDNECTENLGCGLWVGERARPNVVRNRMTRNGAAGICFADDAGGQGTHNHCLENGTDGISLQGRSKTKLEGNFCIANQEDGIEVLGNSTAELSLNLCSENGNAGIRIGGDSQPVVLKNQCEKNGTLGIAVFGNASPRLEGNLC